MFTNTKLKFLDIVGSYYSCELIKHLCLAVTQKDITICTVEFRFLDIFVKIF